MTNHQAEAESYLLKLDDLEPADAYVAAVAAHAHAHLASLEPARQMVALQQQLLESMLPTVPTKEEQVKAAMEEARALARAMPGPEDQVKPAIEEPTAFGSIVRATEPHGRRLCWQIDERSGKHYWQANDGTVEVWSELTDIEVLRVGLGNADEDKLAAAWRDGHNEGLGADIDKIREEAWNDGAREMNTQIHQGVSGHLDNAIGAERKNALERVLTLVEELAP